jgi:uncharacterized Rossmann fold enzyme
VSAQSPGGTMLGTNAKLPARGDAPRPASFFARWFLPPYVQYALRVLRGQEPRAHRTRFYRDLVGTLVPTEVQMALLGLRYGLRGLDVSNNRRLHMRHADRQRCFVIGNGPSLKDMDLSILADEVTIGANSFYKHKDAEAIGLDYLCIGDATFWEDTEKAVEWHRIIASKMPDTTMMFHADARALIARHELYPEHALHHYRHGITVSAPELVHFDFTKPLNVGHTAGSRLAIPLAFYLGFREIYLLGFDASWLDAYEGSYHFYDTHQQWPEFDSQAADGRHPRYADQLINALRDFDSHALLAESASMHGVNIFNAGRGGRLDMYPRVDFESLF